MLDKVDDIKLYGITLGIYSHGVEDTDVKASSYNLQCLRPVFYAIQPPRFIGFAALAPLVS